MDDNASFSKRERSSDVVASSSLKRGGDLNVRVLGVQNTRDRAGPFAKAFLWQLRTYLRSQREEQILAQGGGGQR